MGYRLRLAVEARSDRSIERASINVKPKRLAADPQYSSLSLRDAALIQGTVPIIPYPRNQKKDVRDTLRIDRKFRSHGPQELRRAYQKRAAVERVFSRLKNLAGLAQHSLRGLANITSTPNSAYQPSYS